MTEMNNAIGQIKSSVERASPTQWMLSVQDRISELEDKVEELDHSVKVNDGKFQRPYECDIQNL